MFMHTEEAVGSYVLLAGYAGNQSVKRKRKALGNHSSIRYAAYFFFRNGQA